MHDNSNCNVAPLSGLLSLSVLLVVTAYFGQINVDDDDDDDMQRH